MAEIKQNKFMFFENFKKIADTLQDDLRLKFYDSIIEYALYGSEPKDPIIVSLITAIKPSLDKRVNLGGAPRGNKNACKSSPKEETTQNNLNQPKSTVVSVDSKNNLFLETERKKDRKEKKETETETETETENKYMFEGKIIRLNKRDWNNWLKAYPNLNLYAECLVRDEYLASLPPEKTKNWFPSTAQYFIKQDLLRKEQHEKETNCVF